MKYTKDLTVLITTIMRTLGSVAVVAALVAAGCSSSSDDSSSDSSPAGPEYLIVQNAHRATMEVADEGDYTLVLNGADDTSVYFSDRPARQAGTVSTASAVEDIFLQDVEQGLPNAALTWRDQAGESQTLIFELLSGSYDADQQAITYSVQILVTGSGQLAEFGPSNGEIPTEPFGPVSLFIDDLIHVEVCRFQVFNNSYWDLNWGGVYLDGDTRNIEEFGFPVLYPRGDATGVSQGQTGFTNWMEFAASFTFDSCKGTVWFLPPEDAGQEGMVKYSFNNPSLGSNTSTFTCTGGYVSCRLQVLDDGIRYATRLIVCPSDEPSRCDPANLPDRPWPQWD